MSHCTGRSRPGREAGRNTQLHVIKRRRRFWQIAALAARVKRDFPKMDVLMNNAGVGVSKNLKAPVDDLAGLLTEMDINVGGVVRMTSALIDILTANKGTVINVSSVLAFAPVPAMPIYSATKAAVHSYTSRSFPLEDSGGGGIDSCPQPCG